MGKTVKDIDVVILCGGEGKRLRSIVNDRPKPMAEIGRQPFLDIILNYMAAFGFRRFILSTGYMANFIKQYYSIKKSSFEILLAQEDMPLGTGGGIKNTEPLVKSPNFFAINGDSFCKIDFKKFYEFHLDKKALLSIVVSSHSKKEECGFIKMSNERRITFFDEKANPGKEYFTNAGVYLFRKDIFSLMPKDKNFSLERDFFPKMKNRMFYGYAVDEDFIDIGTPQRYKAARRMLGV